MPSSNSNFVTTCCAPIDSWVRRGGSRLVCCVEGLVVRLSKELTVFVERHSFSFFGVRWFMKMPNV